MEMLLEKFPPRSPVFGCLSFFYFCQPAMQLHIFPTKRSAKDLPKNFGQFTFNIFYFSSQATVIISRGMGFKEGQSCPTLVIKSHFKRNIDVQLFVFPLSQSITFEGLGVIIVIMIAIIIVINIVIITIIIIVIAFFKASPVMVGALPSVHRSQSGFASKFPSYLRPLPPFIVMMTMTLIMMIMMITLFIVMMT